jgi:hypothetical protein
VRRVVTWLSVSVWLYSLLLLPVCSQVCALVVLCHGRQRWTSLTSGLTSCRGSSSLRSRSLF